ncbi:MAG: regulatory iron-sulfur-containing complex subunit RicT [Gemmatales bacterium]|nr:signal peptidase [Gemmatales bacterium]MDW7993553.1 regulatory iron-sulfur-containing complex subunit RicT [Gemmatales bacterium]
MPPRYIVRYGALRNLGLFECADERLPPLARGTRVLVVTDRGTEVGEVLCPATANASERLGVTRLGSLLRTLDDQDERRLVQLRAEELRAREVCQREITRLALPMRIVEVEQLFGGERVVFYFLAQPPEARVDFRELVRHVARELRQRIELRQIGIRDEARLLADYGDCGRPVCCNTFLVVLPPVSMRMAKLQKTTVDPAKLSGRCGRLKCCLRFEYETYDEMQRQLPAVGSRVLTAQGEATVLAQEILAQRLLVHYTDGRTVLIEARQVLRVLSQAPQDPSEANEPIT